MSATERAHGTKRMAVRTKRVVATFALLGIAAAARAETPPLSDAQAKKLFNLRGCNACHAADETRIGPAYRTVALRYKGPSADNVDWLANKILNGGAGSWGNVPMIKNPAVPPDEAKAIARWILSLGPAPAAH